MAFHPSQVTFAWPPTSFYPGKRYSSIAGPRTRRRQLNLVIILCALGALVEFLLALLCAVIILPFHWDARLACDPKKKKKSLLLLDLVELSLSLRLLLRSRHPLAFPSNSPVVSQSEWPENNVACLVLGQGFLFFLGLFDSDWKEIRAGYSSDNTFRSPRRSCSFFINYYVIRGN